MQRFLMFLILLSLQNGLIAQNWNQIYSIELDAESFLLDKQFEKAAERYIDALSYIPTSTYLKFKVGFSYLRTPNKKSLAINFLEEAAAGASADYNPRSIKEERAPPEAYYHLGRAYQINRQFDKAINAFVKYKEFLDQNDPLVRTVDRRIASCRNAPQFMVENQALKQNNLGNLINNRNPNFNAVISGDGKTMAFTSLGNNGYDIYIAKKKGDTWERPRRISDDLRANFLKTSSMSYDGTWLYLVDDFADKGSIFDTFFEDGSWVKAKKLKKPINSKHNESHASISPDGNTLYFTSDRPGGLGGLDIYRSTKDNKGRWGTPENLGSRINTEFNEDTPFLTPDGNYLFFSSEGHNSIGGYDIFYTDIAASSAPINLGYPVNNSDDNLFYYPQSLTEGYMAFYDLQGYGPQDIYKLQIVPFVNLLGNISFVGNKQIEGEAIVTIYSAETIEPVAELRTNLAERNFSKKLMPGLYRIEVVAEGAEDFVSALTIAEDFGHSNYNFDIELVPIIIEQEPLLALQEEMVDLEDVVVADPIPTQTRDIAIEQPREAESEPPPQPQQIVTRHEPVSVQPSTPKPIKEVIKPAEPKLVVDATSSGQFTVQIMALIVPVSENHFANISGVTVIQGDDGYYRYTVGAKESREEAREILRQLRLLGYKDAFIRRHQTFAIEPRVAPESNFTIQIFALKNQVDPNRFSNLPNLSVVQGDDTFYRYFTGNYNTYEQASRDLPRIVQLGYKDAFIKKR